MNLKALLISALVASTLTAKMVTTTFAGEHVIVEDSGYAPNTKMHYINNGRSYDNYGTEYPHERNHHNKEYAREQPTTTYSDENIDKRLKPSRYKTIHSNDNYNRRSNPSSYTTSYEADTRPSYEVYGLNPYEEDFDQSQLDRRIATERQLNQRQSAYLVPSTYEVSGQIDLRNDPDLQQIYYGRKDGAKNTEHSITRSRLWHEPVEIEGSVLYRLVTPDKDSTRRKYEKVEVYFESNDITRTVVIQTN